jgi:hypothetical protein
MMRIGMGVIALIALLSGAYLLGVRQKEPASTAATEQTATTSANTSQAQHAAAPDRQADAQSQNAQTNADADVGDKSSGAAAADSALPAGSAWLTTLPLGDGKYVTDSPKKGYVYICHVAQGGAGAQINGPWIHGSTWTPSEKVHVQGAVSWPQATYTASISGSVRTIASNDLPTDHTTGSFPIAASDPAAQYDRNPNAIAPHSYSFTLPASPAALAAPDCIYGMVGILDNGVLLFDAFDALYRDALAHELQDSYDGHPNNAGYHFHGFIDDIKGVALSQVVGFAFDGFPITGSELPSGAYLHTADLDECHGITSTIELDGKDVSTYHYVLTQDFPYSVGCFRGRSYEPLPGR